MSFAMIPFVTVVSFTLMGIEGIASEIEQVRRPRRACLSPSLRLTHIGPQPFGVDDSDLPLDLFCAELRNEVEHTIYRLAVGEEEFAL